MSCPTDYWTESQGNSHRNWIDHLKYKYDCDWPGGNGEWVGFLQITWDPMEPGVPRYRKYTEKCWGCTDEQIGGIYHLMKKGETFETSFKLVVGYE